MPSVLSDVCWNRKRARDEEVSSWRTEYAHIVVFYQDRDGAYDRFQGKEHIGRFLGDLYGHPGRTVRRLPARVTASNSSAIVRRATGIVECGTKGEDGG